MQAESTTDPPDPTSKNRNDRDAPRTPKEAVTFPLRPGDAAIELYGGRFFFVLRASPTPAGRFTLDDGRTLAEAEQCDPTADVVVCANITDAREEIDTPDELHEAIADGEIEEVARPVSRLAVCLDEFIDAQAAGEWNGLAAYVEAVRR